MLRKILCVGDKPETDGVVLPYSGSSCTIGNNHQVAMIGGKAHCNKCGQDGTIVLAGGTKRPKFSGSLVALEFDLLHCGCQPLPKMIVITHDSVTVDDGD